MQTKFISQQTTEKISELLQSSADYLVLRYDSTGFNMDLKFVDDKPESRSFFLISYLFYKEPKLKKLILDMTEQLEASSIKIKS